MTSDGVEESQVEEGGMGGPGAPTPLSALEVRFELRVIHYSANSLMIGCCRPYEERYSIGS